MKKTTKKLTIFFGIVCVLFTAASTWYTITFNDSRLVEPMDFSKYVFQVQDLPMLLSGIFLGLFVLYLFIQLIRAIVIKRFRESGVKSTRKLNPKLGLLGFCGFFGLMGFWTYSVDKTIFPFAFFMFFGFFGFFYEGKMSDTFMDERYLENKMKAHFTANKIALSIIFLSVVILGRGSLLGNLEYTLIALLIIISLSIALELFLSEYLLYHYDHDLDKQNFQDEE